MKLSLQWLKRHVDLDLDQQQISEILTDIGLEVEGMEEIESIKGGLEGIVVGEVKTCGQHPNADRLSITTVDYGIGKDVQIVCGAPNVAAGQKVLIATPGTKLYDNEGGSFTIKEGKIRGEASLGMICAEDELGLGSSHDGIMVLPPEVSVGTLAKDYFEVSTDVVYDIGLTPNRSDGTNHLGSAKDLAAYIKVNINPEIQCKDHTSHSVNYTEEEPIKVIVEDYNDCPRFSGVLLKNIVIKESPSFIKNYLNAIGVRPINNVVDITNFILHDIGQPLHAYDAEKIAAKTILVKKLPKDTPFLSLDEKERKLLADDLMVCDGNSKPMCIAGVFGGLESGVTEGTTSMFLEAAHFNAKSVRVSSTKHNLRTDAAKVFEKGSDPNITTTAINMAVHLLEEFADAKVASKLIDIYPKVIAPAKIEIKVSHVNRLMGADLGSDEILKILSALEIETENVDGEKIICHIPTNKADVLREVDVIEEILRIYGFNKIELPQKLSSTLQFADYPNKRLFKERISAYCAHQGYNEMMGLSLIESNKYATLDSVKEQEMVFINNTSNVHLDIMRPDMMLSGLQSVRHNINYQQNDLALFEFGKSYRKEEAFVETEYLSVFLSGNSQKESWKNEGKGVSDFYELKGMVKQILNLIGIQKHQTSEIEDDQWVYGLNYHQGPRSLAKFGLLSEGVLKKAGIEQQVFYAEFPISHLFDASKKQKLTVREISKFPSIRRDLAIVVDEAVKYQSIAVIAKKTAKSLLSEIDLFDVYRHDEHVGKGKKSYAIKFVFSDVQKTLKDKEIEKIMKQLITKLSSELGAVIRS